MKAHNKNGKENQIIYEQVLHIFSTLSCALGSLPNSSFACLEISELTLAKFLEPSLSQATIFNFL